MTFFNAYAPRQLKRLLWLMAFLASALAPGPVYAATCTVSATPLAFGAFNVLSGSAVDTTGTVTVTCQDILSILVSYQVTLSTGTSSTFTPRKMASGSNRLDYNVYLNSLRTNIFGNGSGGTAIISDSYLLQLLVPQSRDYTVYARINANQQSVSPGTYSDTLTMTVSY